MTKTNLKHRGPTAKSDKQSYQNTPNETGAIYKNWGGKQGVIKNSKDKKYYVVKGHPHGMPPGQAKKIYAGNGKVVKVKGNNGNGKGKGKH